MPEPKSMVSTGVALLVTLNMRILPAVPRTGAESKVILSTVSTHIPLALLAGERLVADIVELTMSVALLLVRVPAALVGTTLAKLSVDEVAPAMGEPFFCH